MLEAAATGALLGLAGGLSPGPLTALVLSETLRHGRAAGAKVAVVPVLTDGPLIALVLAASAWVARVEWLVSGLGLVGAAVLLWLAWDTARAQPPVASAEGPTGSLRRALLTNLANPHPYLFWFGVGGPILIAARADGWGAVAGFVVAFFAGIVGTKLALAWFVDRLSDWFVGARWRWTMRALALGLVALAAQLAWQGVDRLVGPGEPSVMRGDP